jgi:peptidoglycan LD-endopeptidase CwlK
MKYDFGPDEIIDSLHPDLIDVFTRTQNKICFKIIEGHRGREKQDAAFAAGLSMKKYPNGLHNTWPSLAADFIYLSFDGSDKAWMDDAKFEAVFSVMEAEAEALGIKLQWGGAWKKLHDTDHVQLVSKNNIPYKKNFKPE